MALVNEKQLEEYRAAKTSAAFRLLKDRGKIRAEGPDHVSFLHAMLSNEVQRLEPHQGRYAAFLTATGKMVADLYCYRFPASALLDVQKSLLADVIEKLEAHLIMDEVELRDESDQYAHVGFLGPGVRRLLEPLLEGRPPEGVCSLTEVSFDGERGWWIAMHPEDPHDFEVLLPAGGGGGFYGRLIASGLAELSPETFDLLRLERGVPLFGVDMDQKNYPMEAGLERAVSLTKGCYIGQEVVARATHIGGVPRKLRRLQVEGDEPPEAGAEILGPEGRSVGFVTSAARSPDLSRAIALGYLKRAHADFNREFRVRLGSGSQVRVRVVERFHLPAVTS
ncbi:MAG TPA: glycine cleavage T C-terminal barrel domain-containing protein [Acidobacteriota bacterium]|nr:glycine cleavage T C-terminal barrel domain-containing protein [Acidobacteriota bacterium]